MDWGDVLGVGIIVWLFLLWLGILFIQGANSWKRRP